MAFQVKLRWDDPHIDYLPSEGTFEVLWDECAGMLTRDNQPNGDPSLVFPCGPFSFFNDYSTRLGAFLQLEFRCQEDGVMPLYLVSREGDAQLGTHFWDIIADKMDPYLDPELTHASVTCG